MGWSIHKKTLILSSCGLLCSQVQLLYDLAAKSGRGNGRSTFATPLQRSTAVDQATPTLTPSEDTLCALKRLSEQSGEKMTAAANKTDFKEAALWRNRRDALLSTMRDIENGFDVAGDTEVAFATG